MTGETDTEIPETGAVFTFGKSKIANNVPSRLWLKNDTPVHISCGQSHSAFVTEQGRLFVFGNNNRGQLGLQTKGPVNKPVCVKVLKGERAQFVACGTDHTLVSTSQGDIFAAGGNSDGQLGLGHCNDSISFQRLHPFCDYAPIKLLSAGGHTSAALTEDGRLFLWGDNSVGQLGLGNDSHALLPKELKLGQPIQWVSCGYRHSAVVTDNGDVFTFGESADGRLGLSAHQLANHSHPQRVESLHGVLQVECGGKHTLALTEDELYSFGRGEFGQLGLGTLVFVTDTPVALGHFRKGRVTHVTCGESHSALITDSGLLYTFGDGRHGKLGHGDENFTNQFSPTVCQRFFDYSVMTVACGSSHMLVFARPRQQESQEVCLEDDDVTYSYLDRCYTSMLQGQQLEHIADPGPTLVSQPTFLPTSLPTSHRWSLSTRARRRQRESSSAQFGPEFCNLPPPTTGFTALALTGNILQPRSPTDTPKRFKTEVSVESASTSITLPARTPPLPPITKSPEDCHNVGTSENSMSDKTHEVNKHSGRVENIPQQAPPTEVQTSSVFHLSVTESSPPSNLKRKKPRSRDPKNPGMAEEHSSATASRSQKQSKIYKKPIQSTNNKSKSQTVEVRLSPDRMAAKENEGISETCSTNTDPRDNISKADKHSKVQHADSRGQEVTALAEMEQETKSSPIEIQKKSSPVEEVERVRTTPTKVQEVKSPKIKEMGIPVRATKRVKSPVKVQEMPSGTIEVSKVESTPQADAQRDIKPSFGNAQEVRSTGIDTQEQGNSTPVKIPAKMQSTPKKGKEKNDVDTEENPSELTPKKAKKKRSYVERAPMSETAPKIPSPLSVSIPTQISKAKKPVESENSNFQIKPAMPAQGTTDVKRENDCKIPQNSDISFPPIKNRKSGRTAKKSQSASNLQSDHKNSQSPTDKVLTEQKHEFPSIKSLAPERGHSFSSLWSNNQSTTNKFSATKETELSSGKLSPSSSSPQHKQSPLKENKLSRKTVEPEEPDRKPQAEQSIMGSVVSSLPAMAIASAAPLLIKAAEVFSETPPEPSTEMSSVSKETTGSNILLEQEVDQDSTVQDVLAVEETDDSIIKQQNTQDVQNEVVSNENEMWVSGKIEEEEHVKDSETERKEVGGEEESLGKEEDESEGVGQEEENGAVEDEEERENKNYEDRGESAQQGENSEEEEGEEEESEAAGEEEDDSGQSSKSEEEMSTGEGSGDETEREDEEQSEGQEKEEDEEGETDEKEEEDEESGGTDKEEERESWDEGNEGEVEDGEEEQEGESSNEEKSEAGEQSESDSENKNESSDEEEGESEEKDESEQEEEENETVEGEGEEESEEEGEVGNEDAEENQEEESDHEEEEENRDWAKEELEEEEEEGEEDKEEEVDEEENNEELKNMSEEEEESVREKEERQNEVEAEDEEKMSETDGDEEKQEEKEPTEDENGEIEEDEKEGKIDTNGEKFREHENLDISEAQETERGDEDGETDKLDEMKEENDEEESGSEEEAEEEEIDPKEENITTERKQRETNEEEEEEEEEEKETEQKEKKNRRNQRETSEEEEEQEEESEEEEEESEQEETNIKTEKNRGKQRESSEEEEEQEEENEEESEQEEKNTKTEKNRRKQRESSEEEEEQEEESEEQEEETEQEETNIKTEKNRGKQRESSEEEEEQEEENEEESEQEEKNSKTEKNKRKQRKSSEEEEEQEEESEEQEEEEEIEQKEKNIKIEKIRRKQRETSEEEEEQSEGDEEEEEEEETEQKEKNTKKDKQSENNDEEEEQEEEGEDEEEEEAKQKDKNIKIEKNERKQRETSEEEEEAEEEEEEEEGEDEEGEEEEEEEEKTKKVPKQRAKPNVLPPRRQTNAQRDRQKTRQRHQQNVKGKKQTDSGAQDPQFWNNVLPQYLNLK